MRLSTPRFGELEVKEEDIIVFPSGILGFDDVHRYVLLEHSDDSVFHILQGVDDPAVAFVLIDPRVFRPDYRAEIAREQVAVLELEEDDDAVVRAIVTVPADNPTGVTANLQAPIVLNSRKRLGCQVVMPDGPYGVRHPILAEMRAAAGGDSGATDAGVSAGVAVPGRAEAVTATTSSGSESRTPSPVKAKEHATDDTGDSDRQAAG